MGTRALVLGGGGPVGIAWEAGLIAGLAEAGIDLSQADFIMGTSAGSYVGAHLASGRTPADVAAPFLGRGEMPVSASEKLTAPPDLTPLIGKIMESYAGVRPSAEVCGEIGAWALASAALTEEVYLATFDHALAAIPADSWPGHNFACTTVDAESGEFVLWNREADVPIRLAVASSCAVPGIYPPVTITAGNRARRYMDGGMRSATNADLAKDYDMVVVIALSGESMPEVFRRPLERELQVLRDSGSRVELIRPDAASLESFGPNLMDPRRRPAAATSGFRQGQAGIETLRTLWA